MKIRFGFVSNSSSSSFILKSKSISLERVQQIVDECWFKYFSSKYKKVWNVSEFSRRQINAVKREMKQSSEYKNCKIRRFDMDFAEKYLAYDSPLEEIKKNKMSNNIEIACGDNELGLILSELSEKLSGIEIFWG